jgi:hypothetical protein
VLFTVFRKILDHVGRRSITTTIIVLLGLAVILRTVYLASISQPQGVAEVTLFYDPAESRQNPEVKAAYDQFFAENGIQHRWISFEDAILLPWENLPNVVRAIVLPDRICQRTHDSFNSLLTSYVRRGGTVVVVQDAGVRDRNGFYRKAGAFDSLLGIHYIRASESRSRAFSFGLVQFTSESAADGWSVPSGKLDGDRYLVGYGYGRLSYAVNRAVRFDGATTVDAWSGTSPVVAHRTIDAGNVYYFNLPLGELKASGDSLPMHAFLRTALFGGARMPHLVASPEGLGRLVVNLHIDSNAEWLGIPNLVAHGLLRKDVRMEFDVTAGPDMAKIGDGRGFDACGPKGEKFLTEIAKYGAVGDHGGWAHNYFSSNLEAGKFSEDQVAALVARNTRCLQSVLGTPIRSYAAPDGAHPQPMMTKILESQGIDSYYYTGDSGSPALRPFYNGKIVGKTSWAYPVMTLGTAASFQEMAADGVSPARTERWLKQVLAFTEQQRGIYLVYTHSYDLRVHPKYIPAFAGFLDALVRDQRLGLLRTITMPEATDFLQRYVQTTFTYSRTNGALSLQLDNPQGLRDIAFALPDGDVRTGSLGSGDVALAAVEGGYHIYYVTTGRRHLSLTIRG